MTAADYDVVVVGAGPAGSSAARTAASAGARVLLLDRARFPRYKTCGGGITGVSLRSMPDAVRRVVEPSIRRVVFTHEGRRPVRVAEPEPILGMVTREAFDQALVDAAIAAGADFRDGVLVRDLTETGDGVEVTTADGVLRAAVVIGADGSAGRCARYVGVRVARADLGLEQELGPADGAGAWAGEVRIDWGAPRGSYAWVFPKADRLAVGVIQARGSADETRAYLARWTARCGLGEAEVRTSTGHLTRWREPGSPVRRGRVLVAGDAAGLLEPWMREGISYALRSGAWAGESAAAHVAGDGSALVGYEERIERELGAEQAAGALMLRVFERAPGLVHAVLRFVPAGRRYFVRFCRGTVTLSRFVRHPPVRFAARLLR